jgi:hypothetical protein
LEGWWRRARRVGNNSKATTGFDAALDIVFHTASAFVKQLDKMERRPSSMQAEFGLKVTGETGVFGIAKAGGEANFKIKLDWAAD